MSTLYFKDNEEICYPLAYHIDEAKQNGDKEIKLYHAKRVDDLDYFFCKAYKEAGEVGQCGRSCAKYAPQNKLSGKCKHRGFLYENTGIVRIVKIKPEVDHELRQQVIDSYFNTPQQRIAETAKLFGLTYNQAKHIIYHSGRKKKRFNPRAVLPAKRKEIFDSWWDYPNQTQSEIARKFGISPVTVHNIINEFSKFRKL